MAEVTWRWADSNGQQRRVRMDELRAGLAAGLMAPNTPVWRPGWTKWQPANEVPELMTSALAAANGVVPNIPPPPLAMVAVQHEYEAKSVPPPPVDVEHESPPPPPHFVPMPVRSPSIPPPMVAPASPRPASVAPPPLAPPQAPSRASIPPAGPHLAPPAAPAPSVPPPKVAPSVPPPNVANKSIAKPTIPFGAKLPVPDPEPAPAPAPAPAPNSAEELSASMLLDEASERADLPPPTDPIIKPSPQTGSVDPKPGGPGLRTLFGEVSALKPKNKFVLPVFAVVGAALGVAVLGAFVTILRAAIGGTTPPAGSVASASAQSPAPRPSSVSSAQASPAQASPAQVSPVASAAVVPSLAQGTCAVRGRPHVLVSHAFVGAGLELRALPSGFAVGFATSSTNGIVMRLDPELRVARDVARTGSKEPLRQVLAGELDGKLTPMSPGLDKSNRARRLSSDGRYEFVADSAQLLWGTLGGQPSPLFSFPEPQGPVDALRASPNADGSGYAIAARRGAQIVFGRVSAQKGLAPEGQLHVAPGLGGGVGAPAVALSETGDGVVVYADHARAEDPYALQWVHDAPTGPSEAHAVLGVGTPAQSPSLAPLGAGRFVLAWTEGPAKSHQVRAAVTDAKGTMLGAPFEVSLPGQNAGQAQIAVRDGMGAVAYFVESGGRYGVAVIALRCAPPR